MSPRISSLGEPAFNDPFGAPEFIVEAVAYRELVGTDMMRLAWLANERGERIIRFKAVVPITSLIIEHAKSRAFLTDQRQGGVMPNWRVM